MAPVVRVAWVLLAAASCAALAPLALARPAPAAAAATVDPAVAKSLRSEAGGKLKSFYRARGWWPLWVDGDRLGSGTKRFVSMLETADLDGVDPGRYDIERLHQRLDAAASGDPRALARAEVALSEAFVDYVRDVRAPHLEIIFADPAVEPQRLKPDEIMSAAARAPAFADYVSAMGWMSPIYVGLRQALARTDDRDRAALIRLNMDRARLLPGPWTKHVVVNAASQRLTYYEDGAEAGSMKVVAGTTETPTPMMAGVLRYATLNPYWNVPTDLVRKRIAPQMLKGASLRRLNYEALSSWDADAAVVEPKSIDWRAVAAGDEELRLRELPGRGNSMGRVKFMFPNDEGIYLHDTNDKKLFAKPVRLFSNGCVRLEDADRLGRWLIGKQLTTTSTEPEQHVALAQPVPVFLLYFTATPGAKGVAYAPDRYHRDGVLDPVDVAGR